MDKEKRLFKAETSLSSFSIRCTAPMTTSPHSYQERDHPFPQICSLNRQGDKKKKIPYDGLYKTGRGNKPQD